MGNIKCVEDPLLQIWSQLIVGCYIGRTAAFQVLGNLCIAIYQL